MTYYGRIHEELGERPEDHYDPPRRRVLRGPWSDPGDLPDVHDLEQHPHNPEPEDDDDE